MRTQAVHDLVVQAWWSSTQVYSDHFFERTAGLDFLADEQDFTALFFELQMIRDSFEQADCPPCAMTARMHLLNSMSRVMLGFREFVAGNVEAARLSLNNAHGELQKMQDELDHLGVEYFWEQVH